MLRADHHIDCIAIGVGSKDFPLIGRQPGWDAHSYGYHSDDGRLFHGSGTRSAAYGPRFGANDVIGCGVCVHSRKIFYTLNGKFLGVAFTAKASNYPLYPLVGLDSHCSIHFNFGQLPFVFDLGALPSDINKVTKKAAAERGISTVLGAIGTALTVTAGVVGVPLGVGG